MKQTSVINTLKEIDNKFETIYSICRNNELWSFGLCDIRMQRPYLNKDNEILIEYTLSEETLDFSNDVYDYFKLICKDFERKFPDNKLVLTVID